MAAERSCGYPVGYGWEEQIMRQMKTAVLFTGLLAGCPGPGGDTDDSGTGEGLAICESAHDDPYTVNSVTLSGDVVSVDVSYGGGCETHDWDRCWDGMFAESYPVQATVTLGHDGHDDACDAWISETIEIDLTPLREAYLSAYGVEHDTMTVHVAGESLSYVF